MKMYIVQCRHFHGAGLHFVNYFEARDELRAICKGVKFLRRVGAKAVELVATETKLGGTDV